MYIQQSHATSIIHVFVFGYSFQRFLSQLTFFSIEKQYVGDPKEISQSVDIL